MKKYPIGIQDFRKLREEGFIYVDKTEILHHLISSGGYYFLSRPRRFGKSMLVSTLKEIFSGSRELFKGLWIEDKTDWQVYPVIHLSFDRMGSRKGELLATFNELLSETAQQYDVVLEKTSFKGRIGELLSKISAKGQKIILLIDEYDKPILDQIDDGPLADENRSLLKDFYDVLKSSDAYLHFVFITGISKFAKISVFSGLNNLNDITLDAEFATICGYTQKELEVNFGTEIALMASEQHITEAALYEKIKAWYNGYGWLGERVYNPFSILNFIRKKTFSNFWFATGHPSFLIKRLTALNIFKLENIEVNPMIFDGASVDEIDWRSLLFQTGYLTVTSENTSRQTVTLNFPNNEVKDAFHQYMLGAYAHQSHGDSSVSALQVKEALESGDPEQFKTAINALFASIPYDIFLANYEAYYQSILYITLQLLGMFVKCEVHTSNGRIDTVVHLPKQIYIIEFKVDDTAESALAQIKEKGYATPYLSSGKTVTLVGVGMSKEDKAISSLIME